MPVTAACSNCGASFRLKDEFAGKKLRCQQCQAVIVAPELEADFGVEHDDSLHPAFQLDRYLLAQKVLTINENYKVSDEKGNAVLFIRRRQHFLKSLGAILAAALVAVVVIVGGLAAASNLPREAAPIASVVLTVLGITLAVIVAVALGPKRHIEFFDDEKKKNEVLEIKQDAKWQIVTATYTLIDPNEGKIGSFTKHNFLDILRKRWLGFDRDGNKILVAREDSVILSLLRRLIGPLFGLLRTNFVIMRPAESGGKEQLIGEFNRKFTLVDKYVLDLTHDRGRTLDRRMAVALAVMLDTGERR
jgi:hypothetical protein